MDESTFYKEQLQFKKVSIAEKDAFLCLLLMESYMIMMNDESYIVSTIFLN